MTRRIILGGTTDYFSTGDTATSVVSIRGPNTGDVGEDRAAVVVAFSEEEGGGGTFTGMTATLTTTELGSTPMNSAGFVNLVPTGRPNDTIRCQIFYLLDADLITSAAAGGSLEVAATSTGGSTITGVSWTWMMFDKVNQTQTPTFASNTATGATSISVNIDADPFDGVVIGAQVANNNLSFVPQVPFTEEVTDESRDLPPSAWTEQVYQWSDTNASETTFQTSCSTGGQSLLIAGLLLPTVTELAVQVDATSTITGALDANRNVATTVARSATVTAQFDRAPTFITSLSALSTASVTNLDRGPWFVTTVPGTTTVTSNIDRDTILQTLITPASTVTVQPIMRTAGMATTVEGLLTPTGKFNATRPLAALVEGLAVIRPAFGNTFVETGYSPTPGDYVELFEIDTTVIGGSDVFRFIPHRFETPDVLVEWKGNQFIQFPVDIEGFEQQATGSAPPQPTMRIANVNKFILAAVLELGDIVGAKVTRWRTYARFLDNGETPDSNAHYAPDIYYIQQKTAQTKEGFEFTLSSALDLPGIKLPRRQILKDQSSDDRNLYAPGAANVRFRGR